MPLTFVIRHGLCFSNFQANANLATPTHPSSAKNVQHLTYKIAEVDPRFGLSQEQLIQITQQAADIWKEGTGKITLLMTQMQS